MTFAIEIRIHGVDVGGDTPLLLVLSDVLTKTGTTIGDGKSLPGAHIGGSAQRSRATPIENIGISGITLLEAKGAMVPGARVEQARPEIRR